MSVVFSTFTDTLIFILFFFNFIFINLIWNNFVFRKKSKDLAETSKRKKIDNIDNFKKLENGLKRRKSIEIMPAPTITDFPSIQLLNHDQCGSILIHETFFVAGFSPEVFDIFNGLIFINEYFNCLCLFLHIDFLYLCFLFQVFYTLQ